MFGFVIPSKYQLLLVFLYLNIIKSQLNCVELGQ